MYDFDPSWLAKLDALRAEGIEPYPHNLTVTHVSTELHTAFHEVEEPDPGVEVIIGGRVMFRNKMGRAMFLRESPTGASRPTPTRRLARC